MVHRNAGRQAIDRPSSLSALYDVCTEVYCCGRPAARRGRCSTGNKPKKQTRSRGIPTARIFMRKADEVHGRTAHPSSNGCYIRYPDSQLRNGNLAAHRVDCLVLLGSPPDTIHRALLRKTRSSTPLIRVRRHSIHPRSGIPPRCSGLRVTGHRYLPK